MIPRIFAVAFTMMLVSVYPLAAQADEPAEPEHAEPAPAPWRTFPAFTVGGGATTLRLLGLPFNGGQALFGVSAETSEHFSLAGDLEYSRAATSNGLVMQVVRLHASPTLVLDRIRLGVGLHLTLLAIDRETGGSAITQLGLGLHARASVDLVRLGDHGGLFLSIKPSIARVGPATLAAGDAALGIRF